MKIKQGRKLDNWLESFLEWTMPRSETPESMLRWVGIYTLSVIAKRRVGWPRRLLGGYEVFPALYVVFVGEPAVVRKSTTVGFAEDIIVGHNKNGTSNPVTFSGDITSHSKLIEAIANSPDSSVAIFSGELSSFIQATPEATYELLTDLFDSKRKLDWSTWAHGDKLIKEPSVSLLAATTPAWISKQPPEYFVGGGFASRVLFIYEEEPRQREIFYDHLDEDYFTGLEKLLVDDLSIISSISGEFIFANKETKEHIRSWYKEQRTQNDDVRMKGYYGRKHVHGLKVAGLLSLAERNDKAVSMKHWNAALEMLDYIERRMDSAFATLGQNPFSVLMNSIVTYVEKNQTRTLRDIAGRFYHEGYTLDQLKSALVYLCTDGKLKASGETANPKYIYRG